MTVLKPFSRRALLRGASAAVALPFFESLVSGRGRAAAAGPTPPKRLIVYKFPQGVPEQAVPGSYRPTGSGADFMLSPCLSPLQALKQKILVLGGVGNTSGEAPDSYCQGQTTHEQGACTLLSGTPCANTPMGISGTCDTPVGVTFDQVLANHIGSATPGLPSLQLATALDNWYADNVIWADTQTPLPWVLQPSIAFNRVFGNYQPTGPDRATLKRIAYRQSVLDSVQSGIARVRSKVSTADKVKLDEYLTSVRNLEQRLTPTMNAPACDPGTSPADVTSVAPHVKAMLDLMVLSIQCDRTRVIDFQLESSNQNTIYPGCTAGYHDGVVHGKKWDEFQTGCTWIFSQYAYLLGALDATPDPLGRPGQSLLDNTVVVAVSEFGFGDGHWTRNIPCVVGGNLDGAFNSGRYLTFGDDDAANVCAQNSPVANLWLTLLQAFGVGVSSFGDSSGTFDLT